MMKRILLYSALLSVLGAMIACKGASGNEAEKDSSCATDTVCQSEVVADTAFVEQRVVVTQNGVKWEDVTISQAAFEAAASEKERYQIARSDRTPDAMDSDIVRSWAKGTDFDFAEWMEESGFYRFEGKGDIIELCMGDYCCTRTRNDTTLMPSSWYSLSNDNLLASYYSDVIYWDPVEGGMGCVYIYPYNPMHNTLGKQYSYETHPRWYPAGDSFWGADGWYYVDGWDEKHNNEYHKVRPLIK